MALVAAKTMATPLVIANLHSSRNKLSNLAATFIAIVIISGTLVLLGWQFDIDIFKRPVPHLVAMNPATAASFILFGSAFLLVTAIPKKKSYYNAGIFLTALVILISVLKLLGTLAPNFFQVDQVLFAKKIRSEATHLLINSMAVNTALGFVFSGLALLTLNFETKKKRKPADFIAILVFCFGLFSALGYLYGAPEFYDLLQFLPMALHTAICFMLIGAALLIVKPDKGISKEIFTSLTGGITGRLLIPIAILLPSVLGVLRAYSHKKGILSVELGITLLVLLNILIFTAIIFKIVVLLNRKELLRQRTEQNFESLLESAPDALVIVNENGLIQLANTQAVKMFGYSKEEMIGQEVEMLMPQKFRMAHKGHKLDFFANPKMREMGVGMELLGKRKDNSEFFVEISLSIFHSGEGMLASASIRDITEKKKIREETASANKRFSSIFHLSPVPISISSLAEGRFVLVNDAFCETTGHKREDLIGARSVDIKLIDPDSRKEIVGQLKSMGGQGKNIEQRLRKRNGDLLEVFTFAETIELDGEPCILTALVDITERKKMEEQLRQSEEMFRSMVTSVKDYAIIMLDAGGKIITWNEGAAAINGYNGNEVIGNDISIFYPPNDIDSHVPELLLKKAAESGRAEHEGWRKKKDGSLFWAYVVITALHDDQQRSIGFAKVTRDMTEMKSMMDLLKKFNEELTDQVAEKTQQLEDLTQELRHLAAHLQTAREEEKKSIARELHDELGQMLTGLRMDAMWLKNNIKQEGESVPKRFERMLELLNDTRQTMRNVTSNLHPAVLEDLGLVAALDQQVTDFEKRYGIKISFESDRGVLSSNEIPADIQIGVYRIFQESLTNIAKHADAHQVDAFVKIIDPNLVLNITDDGKGFNLDEVAVKRTLGLVSIRERALMMNGHYEIHSMPGEGTSILITIPLKPH